MDAKVAQLMEAVGCGRAQAQQYLEIAGGDVNSAAMYFLESGEKPRPDPPDPKKAERHPERKPERPPERKPEKRPARPAPQPAAPEPPRAKAPDAPAPRPQPARRAPEPPAAPQRKMGTMRDYLHDDDPYDEDALYAGDGQRVRTSDPQAEPRKFLTTADVGREEHEREQGCKITIDFYKNGFMLNNHPPFHTFEGGDGAKYLSEMTHQGSFPPALVMALPPEERPKPHQMIHTEIVNHAEDYVEPPPEQQKKGAEGFGDQEHGRTLGGPRAPPKPAAEPPAREKRGIFRQKRQGKGAEKVEAAPPAPAGPPTAPELHLVSGMNTAPVRLRTSEGTFTIQTNPDIHTPNDLLDALRRSRHAVPAAPVLKRAGGEPVQDMRATLGSQGLVRQVLVVTD